MARELREPPYLVKKYEFSTYIFCFFSFLLLIPKPSVKSYKHHSRSSYYCAELCEPGMAPRVKLHMGKQQQEAVDVTDGQKNDAVVQNQAAG